MKTITLYEKGDIVYILFKENGAVLFEAKKAICQAATNPSSKDVFVAFSEDSPKFLVPIDKVYSTEYLALNDAIERNKNIEKRLSNRLVKVSERITEQVVTAANLK